ncbi:MAG: enolase [Candidatus Nealsonbacteria bacterium]
MPEHKIKSIKAREILDSRGYPTVEVELATGSGVFLASTPSGTSKGKYEAHELRDGGDRYFGFGVTKAVENIEKTIAPELLGKDVRDQEFIDQTLIELDGTIHKARLGANAILPVSVAVLKAGAHSERIPLWQWIAKLAGTTPNLPFPCILFMEGGLHGRGDLDTQEFMVVIQDHDFSDRLRFGTEMYHTFKEILIKKFGKAATNVGLEGGFTPPIHDTVEALDLLMKAIKKSKQKKARIILDMAATTFFKDDKYYFEGEIMDRSNLLNFYSDIVKKYPIEGIEDPFSEEDWLGFQEITEKLGRKIHIIGDDLLVTNKERIIRAHKEEAGNSLILKPNQVGTFTETLEALKAAKSVCCWEVFVKHRSGETSDTFLADLAVGLGTGWIMAGAPQRGERVAKYNRLLRISQEF